MNDTLTILQDTLKAVASPLRPDSVATGAEGISRSQSLGYSPWIAVEMFLLTVLLFVVIYRDRQYLLFRLQDFFSPEERRFFAGNQAPTNRLSATAMLLIVACGSVGLVVCGLAGSQSDTGKAAGLGLAMKVAGLSLLFILLKGAMYGVINWVFFRPEKNIRWIDAYFFMTAMTAFVLFPVSLIEMFTSASPNLLLVFLSILFIVYEFSLFYKLIINFKAKKYGFLLIFLYFCAVEILPALFLWRKVGV